MRSSHFVRLVALDLAAAESMRLERGDGLVREDDTEFVAALEDAHSGFRCTFFAVTAHTRLVRV